MALNSFLSIISSGLAANLPAAPEYPGMCLYYETDTGVVDLWTGSAWVVLAETGLQAAITASTTQTLVAATQLIGAYSKISVCANAGDAVKLPPLPRLGQQIIVTNAGAAAASVFPGESTTKIDAGSTGAAVTLTNVKSAIFECTDATAGARVWTSIGMATRSA